jgi:hypothetical protein
VESSSQAIYTEGTQMLDTEIENTQGCITSANEEKKDKILSISNKAHLKDT